MAASFTTDNPAALLEAFRAAINSGEIKTWASAAPGSGDISLADREFNGRAWFRPKTQAGDLIFNIVRGQGGQVSNGLYSYYHGQLIETFLRHFGGSFSTVSATAGAAAGDLV
jgi:hypothetical protein